jgi:hypothetical protein
MCVCISCISIGLHLRAHVCSMCVCVGVRARAPRRCARTLMARRGPAVFMAAFAFAVLCHRPVSRALAAGVTWTLVIASAQWAARQGHTTLVDAAGAIYVLGGNAGPTYLNDVWASTDGGAQAGLALGVLGGVVRGH